MKIYRSHFNNKTLLALPQMDQEVWHGCNEYILQANGSSEILQKDQCPFCKISVPDSILLAAKLGLTLFFIIKVENGNISQIIKGENIP